MALAVVVVLALLVGLHRVNRAFEDLDTVDEILDGSYKRNALQSDYLRSGSERARAQWLAEHERIGKTLKSASQRFKNAESRETIVQMIQDHDSTTTLFTGIVENRGRAKSGEITPGLSHMIENRLLTQMNIRLYEKVLNIGALREGARQRLVAEMKRTGGGIAIFISIAAAVAAVSSWAIGRQLTSRIAALQEGSSIMGEGDLQHRIDIKGRDEFADLSQEYNRMAEKLGLSYRELKKEIAERKLMEEELRKSRDELETRVQERTAELQVSNRALIGHAAKLERLNEELEDFAFVAAHDLQEPLRKIQTFTDMVIKRCALALGSTGKEHLERVLRSAARMRDLLRDLLQFSKVATKPEPFKQVDVTRVVRQAAGSLDEDLSESGGLIEIEWMPEIAADESQLLRLFENLIGNALKYRRADEAPRIKVYARQSGEGCEIFVEDNGMGFDPQYADRIFKPLQRLHGKKEYDGTGMGLAICRKIVEWHGGNIRAESKPGKGSTFVITLPVRQDGMGSVE